MMGCCLVLWRVRHAGVRGVCGGWCGVVRLFSMESAHQQGCGVWSLAGGGLGLRFCPRVRHELRLALDSWPLCCV